MKQTVALFWQKISSFVGWALLPLAAGILIAALIPQPVIGLIYLNNAIDQYSAESMIRQIEYAREHPEVRAVVLVVSGPGGTVA
ncbi:MAG: hypothetical protein L6461_09615, partial [Anaerolineae bacterium]|nr:hypothetical protein [Anaerolineae bacterium]